MTEERTATIVSLRDKWEHEEDFSRWLAENIEVLNKQVKWELTPVQLEAAAWNATRYVDVLCEAQSTESNMSFKVVIENQFDGTNMDHFVRFMQYISIHDAKGAVWIAGYVYSEYIQLVQWLNDNSEIDVYLFTIELEQREGDNPEPVLMLVSGPDTKRIPWDFTKTPAEKRRIWRNIVLSKVSAKCREHDLWQDFKTTVSTTWITESVQHEDLSVSGSIQWYIYGAPDRSTVGINFSWSADGKSFKYYDQIAKHMKEIDNAFVACHDNTPLSWERSRGPCYIVWYNPNARGYECDDLTLMEEEADAIADAMLRLIDATKDFIIKVTPFTPDDSDGE